MKLLLTKGYNEKQKNLEKLLHKKDIFIHGDKDVKSLSLSNKCQLFVIGNIIGVRNSINNINKMNDSDFNELFKFT